MGPESCQLNSLPCSYVVVCELNTYSLTALWGLHSCLLLTCEGSNLVFTYNDNTFLQTTCKAWLIYPRAVHFLICQPSAAAFTFIVSILDLKILNTSRFSILASFSYILNLDFCWKPFCNVLDFKCFMLKQKLNSHHASASLDSLLNARVISWF